MSNNAGGLYLQGAESRGDSMCFILVQPNISNGCWIFLCQTSHLSVSCLCKSHSEPQQPLTRSLHLPSPFWTVQVGSKTLCRWKKSQGLLLTTSLRVWYLYFCKIVTLRSLITYDFRYMASTHDASILQGLQSIRATLLPTSGGISIPSIFHPLYCRSLKTTAVCKMCPDRPGCLNIWSPDGGAIWGRW